MSLSCAVLWCMHLSKLILWQVPAVGHGGVLQDCAWHAQAMCTGHVDHVLQLPSLTDINLSEHVNICKGLPSWRLRSPANTVFLDIASAVCAGCGTLWRLP